MPHEQVDPSIGCPPPRLLTLHDVARFLNVSQAQVYALVRSGELPAIKLGGRGVWRVDRFKLEEYVQLAGERTARWVRGSVG